MSDDVQKHEVQENNNDLAQGVPSAVVVEPSGAGEMEIPDGGVIEDGNGEVVVDPTAEGEEAQPIKVGQALKVGENSYWIADRWVYFPNLEKYAGLRINDELCILEVKVVSIGGLRSTSQLPISEKGLESLKELLAEGDDQRIGVLTYNYMKIVSQELLSVPNPVEDEGEE